MITNSAPYQKDVRLASDEVSRLYQAARRRARLGKFYSMLTGRSRRLLHLSAIQDACRVRGIHYAGTQAVPIDHIRGSEGRCSEFDASFWPLQTRTKRRWLSIALAHYMGECLPAVELIRVGELYFVRDGHHRISVARALGQTHIDAQVIVWEVDQPASLEHPNLVHHPSNPARYQKSSCLVKTGGRLTRLYGIIRKKEDTYDNKSIFRLGSSSGPGTGPVCHHCRLSPRSPRDPPQTTICLPCG